MPIPDFQTLMRPLLNIHADGKEHRNRDLVRQLALDFKMFDHGIGVTPASAYEVKRVDQDYFGDG